MEESQQHEAEPPIQCMDPDLTSVMGWELLVEITRHMGTADRSNWRLVSKAALQAVYDSTAALTSRANSTFTVLPQLLAKCSGLKQLSCRYRSMRKITGLLQLPLRLESLDISRTDVMDLSFIARCTSLQRLIAVCVPGCAGPESRQLAAVLQQLPGLTALDLWANELCVDAARDVSSVLQNLTRLRELDIRCIGRNAAAALFQGVPHLTGMRRLDLDYCYLGGQALLPAILQLTRLQRLHLCSNSLQPDGALILAPALRKLTQLEDLDLSNDWLFDEGVSALAPAIRQLTGLITLDLRDNEFGSAGAQALAPALRHLTRLQDLDLGSNEFEPEGAALLAPAIQELTGLLCLKLFSVDLRAEGMASLAPALQRLTMLQHLDVSGNALGPAGLQALLPGIQQLVSLLCLDLKFNALDRESTLLFAAGIHQLTRLEVLDLDDHGLDDEFKFDLQDIIHTATPGCKVYCNYPGGSDWCRQQSP